MATQLQLRNGTIQEWVDANPILGEAEMGIITDSNAYVIGDGKTRYIDLLQMPFGKGVYEVLVQYGYKGTRVDFCRQLDLSLKNPEQQVGTLSNAGPGWNSFTFPKEFSEDVYITLTAQNAAVFGVLKNITRKGFHYCLYDAAGDTVSENVVVNYIAVASSELNLAQAIAQAAGLNPFNFDNLTVLFADHAAEVVANEAAFNLTKRSGMASGRYICHLTGLNPVTYHNIVSLAGDPTAMDTIAVTEEALTFIVMSPAAYDSIRLSTMSMGKYLAGLSLIAPADYNTVTDLFNDNAALTALVASPVAMQALCASEIASKEMAAHEAAASAVAASSVAMTAVAASSVAMTAVAASSVAYMSIYNNFEAFGILFANSSGLSIIANDRAAVEAMIEDTTRVARLAESSTAMVVLAESSTAMVVLAESSTAMVVLAESSHARGVLLSSEKAWGVVTTTDAFISKYAIGCLESAIHKPENFSNMASVIADRAATAALASSSTAMTALANSSVAIGSINSSSIAKSELRKVAKVWIRTGSGWVTETAIVGKYLIVEIYQNSNPGWTSETKSTQWMKLGNNYFTMSFGGNSNGFMTLKGAGVIDATVRYSNGESLSCYIYNPHEIRYIIIN